MKSTTSHQGMLNGGLLAAGRAWLAAAAEYGEARLRLGTLELKEAGARLGWVSALGAALLFFALMTYLLLVVAVICGLALLGDGTVRWLWATLGVAVGHLLLAGALFFLLRSKARGPLFPLTLDELKKDRIWLTQKPNP